MPTREWVFRGPQCRVLVRAERLRDVLVEAYVRSACHWAEEHFDSRKEQHCAFAAAVMRRAEAESVELVAPVAGRLHESVSALAGFMDALSIVATHEPDVVP